MILRGGVDAILYTIRARALSDHVPRVMEACLGTHEEELGPRDALHAMHDHTKDKVRMGETKRTEAKP